MKWLRLWNDTINDHKWRLVANESGQPVGNVLAVWMSMLINASNSSERGVLEGWQDRYVAAHLGYPSEAVRAIREAMQGVVLDGMRLTGWDRRQRASDDAAETKRKQRGKGPQRPPDGGGNGGSGTEQDIPRPNGHVAGHSANVHGQPADVHGLSMDKPQMSLDCPGDVHETPLNLTLLPTPTSMQKEPLAPPIGGAGKKVAYTGLCLNLSAQKFADLKACYHAIPDFLAAVQTFDAELVGQKNPYGGLRAKLLIQHQYWLNHGSAKPAKPRLIRPSGNRVIGGLNARGAA
jgi:hypothetical protein